MWMAPRFQWDIMSYTTLVAILGGSALCYKASGEWDVMSYTVEWRH